MTFGKALSSIAFGLLFAVLAVGLLPFVAALSLGELYGAVEMPELAGIPVVYLFRKMKAKDLQNPKDPNDDDA